MSSRIFLEIVFMADDFVHGGRDEVEDPLQEALEASGLGEVTGGGSGMGKANIDIEVTDLDDGLSLVRSVLQGLGVAQSTVINQYEPVRSAHRVYAIQSSTSTGDA
jgi:hypothetical protein